MTLNFTKKETLAQVFSYEFWHIFKNTFPIEHLWGLFLNNTLQMLEKLIILFFIQ